MKLLTLLLGQSRIYTNYEAVDSGDLDDIRFLSGEILIDGSPSSWMEDASGRHLQTIVRNEKGAWKAEQTWGFEEIEGVRYHTRRIVVRKGEISRRARQVYSFKSL